MYFWLMGQIMLFYIVVVVTICFFFRKFCSDPGVEEDYHKEEAADEAADEAEDLEKDKQNGATKTTKLTGKAE